MEEENKKPASLTEEEREARKKQQQSDPQITELKGYIDPEEKLEPELEDEDVETDTAEES